MDSQNWIVIATGDAKDETRIQQMFEAARLSNPICCLHNGTKLLSFLQELLPLSVDGKGRIPKVVLLDVSVPGKGALEIIAWMKSQPALRGIPIILQTEDLSDPLLGKAVEAGASACLQKNFTFSDFFERTRFMRGQWTITR
jgi:CheY-like chemotaxis protein